MITFRKVGATLLAAALLPGAFATVYDAAADFSLSNPNGVWSYGHDAAGFTLFTITGNDGNFESHNHASLAFLGVYKNLNNAVTTQGTVTYQPNALGQHPGVNGQKSIVRFTAPAAGLYSVKISFEGVDYVGPTTTDVGLAHNGSSLFASSVSGFGSTSATSYMTTLSLAAGDTLDSIVGTGGNGYLYDSTGVDFVVESVPEPATMVGIAVGLLALRRRRKA